VYISDGKFSPGVLPYFPFAPPAPQPSHAPLSCLCLWRFGHADCCWLEHFQCIINNNNSNGNNISLRDELRAKLLPNSHIADPSVALCAAAVAVAMTFLSFLLNLFLFDCAILRFWLLTQRLFSNAQKHTYSL